MEVLLPGGEKYLPEGQITCLEEGFACEQGENKVKIKSIVFDLVSLFLLYIFHFVAQMRKITERNVLQKEIKD